MNDDAQQPEKTSVRFHEVTEQEAGQRVDNFLLKTLKPAPKSLIYRILRKGEVRVDKKRVKPERKLAVGEIVRIPPIRLPDKNEPLKVPQGLLNDIESAVLLEDDNIIAINKPSGLPVHGGSGSPYGLIEAFRQLRPNIPYVELVHRLDKETSGVVLLAKNRKTLNALHELFRQAEHGIEKYYIALVVGKWKGGQQRVNLSLQKASGHRKKMQVHEEGKHSESIFTPIKHYENATLLKVKILTGRMHQIRTQLAHLGYPIIGDDRYGDFKQNKVFREVGIKRLFLHAEKVKFHLDISGQNYNLEAPLATELQQTLQHLQKQ